MKDQPAIGKLRVLIVDDVRDMAQTIANDLEAAGHTAWVADNGGAALQHFAEHPADVVVTDLRMSRVDGLEVLSGIKRIDPDAPVVIMTAFGAIDSAVEAMRRGAFHYITKPFQLETMRALVERAGRERALSAENALLRRMLRESLSSRPLLGESLAMRQLRALIARIADAPSAVLISGETGTGKELAARAIHAGGARADRPFVAVNCAALPEPLLESELFGHARGAFPAADSDRRGLFVEAQGGTIFLDGIGDLPLALQGKLLRVLQSGELRPVGTEIALTVDVRSPPPTRTCRRWSRRACFARTCFSGSTSFAFRCRRSGIGRTTSRSSSSTFWPAAGSASRSRSSGGSSPRRSIFSRAANGPATSASSRTWSSVSRSRPRPRWRGSRTSSRPSVPRPLRIRFRACCRTPCPSISSWNDTSARC
jgi:CheY-like chemotaxis protein